MIRKNIFILLCLVYTMPIFASVQLQVDRDSIESDEMITLNISSKDHLRITPDLTPLKKDFYIVGTSQSSQFNMINGSTQMETQWQVALLPKHSGEILLPSITVGTEKTEPRLIHVALKKPPTEIKSASNQEIFFEATVIPKETFVEEQLVYTLKLYFSRSIENPYLEPPLLADAKVSQNGQDIIYSAVKNGRYYRVLERSYLITPKTTGHLQIQPAVLKGYLEGGMDSTDMYGFPSHSLKPVKVMGPTLAITVKPKPANYSGQWLPAKDVTMNESWQPSPVSPREGEPFTRIIEVTAEGATGEQIPALNVSSTPTINSYAEQPRRESTTNQDVQVGKLIQKIVYIPTTTGKVVLPAISLHWWNTSTQKEEVVTLPEKTIQVLPALTKQPVRQPNVNSSLTVPTPVNNQQNAQVMPKSQGFFQHARNYFWPILVTFLVAAWGLTIWLWRKQIRTGKSVVRNKANPLSASELESQLKEACFANNAKQARRSFLAWAATNWPESSTHALADIVHLLEEKNAAELINEIMKLEATFYSRNKDKWNGSTLWYAFKSFVQKKATSPENDDPLPPLYCSTPN